MKTLLEVVFQHILRLIKFFLIIVVITTFYNETTDYSIKCYRLFLKPLMDAFVYFTEHTVYKKSDQSNIERT